MADFTKQELDDILAKGGDAAKVIAAIQKREQEKKREQLMQGRVFDSLTNKQFSDIKTFLTQEVSASNISYDVNGMVQDMVAALNSNDKESFLKAALLILQTLKVANGI